MTRGRRGGVCKSSIYNPQSAIPKGTCSPTYGMLSDATFRSFLASVKAAMERPRFELYDLENDPDEVKNLAGQARHAKVLDELKGKLKTFQKDTGDPWILKWER